CLCFVGCARHPRPSLMGPSSQPVLLPPQLFREGVPKSEEEWQAAGREAATLLSQYIAINTTNPPGNELKAAEWVKQVLAREGIESQVFEPGPGKANLYARVRGDGSGRPLIFLNHMDVVLASPEYWKVDPFGGVVKDGYVWGRRAGSHRVLWRRHDGEVPVLAQRLVEGNGGAWIASHPGQSGAPAGASAEPDRELADAAGGDADGGALPPRSVDDRDRCDTAGLARGRAGGVAGFHGHPGAHGGPHLQRAATKHDFDHWLEGERQDERDPARRIGGARRAPLAGAGAGGLPCRARTGGERQRRDHHAPGAELAGHGELGRHRAVPGDHGGGARAGPPSSAR